MASLERHVFSALFLIITLTASASDPLSGARGARSDGMGSAIGPRYSIHPDVLRPGEMQTLAACVTNVNPGSARQIQSGDTFRFHFKSSDRAACTGLSVMSDGAGFRLEDFTCQVDDNGLVIQHVGGSAPWSFGDGVCALVSLTPTATATILTSQEVSNRGAYEASSPPALVLVASSDVGTPGPIGPAGPPGPPGPAGTSTGVGARLLLTSTGRAPARHHEPPVVIPGVVGSIDVGSGSQILLAVDGTIYDCGIFPASDGIVHLELDGSVVASRYVEYVITSSAPFVLAWMSGPLAAGRHDIRVLVEGDGTSIPGADVGCVGASPSVDPPGVARLVALEMLP